MAITKDREYRGFDFNLEEKEDKMVVEGRAIVFNTPTVLFEMDGVEYKEKIDSRALEGVDLSDVVLVIDHAGKPAARTRNNTLQLDLRKDGLYIRADLSKNETGRELYEDIKNGFFDTMSFAFTVEEDEYDKRNHMRTVSKIKRIFDVSAVSFPAYEKTSIQARNRIEEAEAEIEALEKAKELRKRLILKTYF